MDFQHLTRSRTIRRLLRFFDEHIYPNEHRYERRCRQHPGNRWAPTKVVEELKPIARAQG